MFGALALGLAGAAEAASRAWCETRTDDFTVVSDLDADAVRALIESLVRLETIAEPYLPGAPAPHRSALKLIVFANAGDFRRTLDTRRFAGFMQPSLKTHRLLIGPDRRGISDTALHEYAHYLLRNRLDVSLPVWFDEGLASLLGATEFEADAALLGALPHERLAPLLAPGARASPNAMSLRQVLAADDVAKIPADRLVAFYDWSWLLTHYLYLGPEETDSARRDALTRYLTERNGSIVDYLETSHHALERALRRHLHRHREVRMTSPAIAGDPPAVRCLDDAERDYELAQSMLAFNPEGALALLEPHRRANPADADLLVAESRARAALDEPDAALELAERAAAAAPENANVLVNLADRRVNDCLLQRSEACAGAWREALGLYRAAIRIDPERYDAVLGLGLAYLYTGRPGDGVNYLRVAYQRSPWASVVNFYLGEGYRLIGDTRAETYLINARNWAPDEFWRAVAQESLGLAGYTDSEG